MRSVRVLRNVVTNYLRFFAGGLLGMLVTPIMVHTLGDGDYGLWVTVFSLTGYFGLIDQGIRPSLVRFVSRDQTLGDQEGLRRTLNSALALFTVAGLLAVAVTVVVAGNFEQWFTVEPGHRHLVRDVVLIAGASVALGFPLSVFGAVLSGLQRYDLANGIGIGVAVLRAVAFVLVLRSGGGLLELAWASLAMTLLGHILTMVVVLRLLPLMRFGAGWVTGPSLRAIGSYGGFAFIGALATSLTFQSDALVITALIGAAAVTPFALAAGLVETVRSLVYSATFVLSPTASELETRGETGKLHAMLLAGAKYSVLLSWPVLFGLMVFGENFLVTWVGPNYATEAPWSQVLAVGGLQASAAQILTILCLPTLLSLPQSTASALLFGVSRHKGVVTLSLVNALVNLALSLWWARPLGLAGVALGTAVPLALIAGIATAVYACRALGMPLARYAWHGMGKAGLASVAFLLPAILVNAWWNPIGWIPLALACSGCWIVFALLAWWWVVGPEERDRWGRMFANLMRRTPAVENA
ncbi:MAG: oligosaccharide flippase family protein [Candidatus Eisenbacteria bacterium]